MTALNFLWLTATFAGLAACLVSIAARNHRRESLLVGGVCFAVAGVLGILSIGILLLAVSAVCIVVATRGDAQGKPSDSDAAR